MPFNWKDFLIFAENIKTAPSIPGPEEAALRSAASRAYYAAFQAALNFGKAEKFLARSSGEDHIGIQRYFREYRPANEIRTKIASHLQRLYNYRRQADYAGEIRNPVYMAEWAIKESQTIFANLEQLAREQKP
jgi:uncharacterized protein (UPF0332 family)